MAMDPSAAETPPAPAALVETVQRNCLIADARHARDMTMCNYLLAMRERYRLEAGLPLGCEVPRGPLGGWLEARERLWDSLAEADYLPLPLDCGATDPFDCDAVNAELGAQRLFYSAGLGHGARPHFCLAVLERQVEGPGHRVLVAGAEYAADLVGPPAALRGGTIYLRERALQRWLWTRIEEWRWRKSNQALGRALAAYGVAGTDAGWDAALQAMTRAEGEAVLLHEQGELRAAALLGTDWEEMLGALEEPRAELLVRAVRDHLADCLVTLPELIAREAHASLHFYAGNLQGMRREIFPEFLSAYESWIESGSIAPLAAVTERGHRHWLKQARRLLALYAAEKGQAADSIAALAQDAALKL